MDDEEIATCVAAAVGRCAHGARIEPLGGKQGLLVCRVRFGAGESCIFKAVREARRRELALTVRLARDAPGHVPAVIAYEEDTKRGLYWLVMQDVGARRLGDAPTAERYAAAARVLAELQVATLPAIESYARLGVPNVGGPEWEDIALRVLEAAHRMGGWFMAGDLPPLEKMVWSVSDITRDTQALPMAVVHGDLHSGNISIGDHDHERLCLLDWGSAYIGAAFLALAELMWPATGFLRHTEDRHRVRAAYLRTWTPILGKPGYVERAVAACHALVRLQLLEESLLRPGSAVDDPFAAAGALRHLQDAWHEWERVRAAWS